MVMNSIIFVAAGLLIPIVNNPLVGLEAPLPFPDPPSKSPKSAAFPSVDIVTNSILLEYAGAVPPKTPLVYDARQDNAYLATAKSPTSTELPVESIVMYCITFVFAPEPLVSPPAISPLVELDAPLVTPPVTLVIKSPKSCAFPVDDIVT